MVTEQRFGALPVPLAAEGVEAVEVLARVGDRAVAAGTKRDVFLDHIRSGSTRGAR